MSEFLKLFSPQNKNLRAEICKDLENLLNEKALSIDTSDWPQIKNTAPFLGIKSFHDVLADNNLQTSRLEDYIKDVINSFEPRLQSVEVEILTNENPSPFLEMRIRADIYLESGEMLEPVYLSTKVSQSQNRSLTIEEVERGTVESV